MLNTGNETVQFLKAPDSRKVHENVWWAKLRTADVPDKMSDELITRILTNYSFEDPDGRLVDVIHYYAYYHAGMTGSEFNELTRFITWKLGDDPAFRMKGRTVRSTLRLARDWRRLFNNSDLGTFLV
jgi:hypothetical protein